MNRIIFRPSAPYGAPNVFSTWTEVYAAIEGSRHFGMRSLEFDNTFATTTIPAGTWDFTDIEVTNRNRGSTPTTVQIADGASLLNFRHVNAGSNLVINYDGTGSVTPIVNPTMFIRGPRVRFTNTSASALPMFKCTNFSSFIAFYGDAGASGLGNNSLDSACPAPLFDVADKFAVIGLIGNAAIMDNAFTGLATGEILVTLRGASAQPNYFTLSAEIFNTWTHAALTGASGILTLQSEPRFARRFAGPAVTAATYTAIPGEVVRADTTSNAITVTLPVVGPDSGVEVLVRHSGGDAATNAVTVSRGGTEEIVPLNSVTAGTTESIGTTGASRTYVSDGLGKWWSR